MNYPLAERRGATNVEYILLLVVAALAVTLGVSALSNIMMLKHVQVAEAISGKDIGNQQVASTFESTEATMTDNGDGTITIAANGSGVAPYILIKDGVQVAEDNAPVFIVSKANGTYEVRDADGHKSLSVVVLLPITNIVIDGVVSDWAPVLAEAVGYVNDPTIAGGDSDPVSTPDRDLVKGAAYDDATHLYLMWRRDAVAPRALYSVAYLDLDADNRIEAATDRILVVRTDASYNVVSTTLYHVGATDVAIGANGVNCATSLGAVVASTSAASDMTADGISLETKISWADLGVSARNRTLIKYAFATGGVLPNNIVDNSDTLLTGNVLP